MSILFKLVAVCDKCGKRHEYEAEVPHDGSPERELLRANEVEHEPPLPEGWTWGRRTWSANAPAICAECTKALHECLRAGGSRDG